MNRLAHWILRLYPAHWRKRYGDELDALLTDTGADARTVADLAKGGLRMQFSTWSFPKLAMTLGFAGLLLGAAFSLLLPSEYTSKATLELVPARIDPTVTGDSLHNPLNERVLEIETEVLSRARLAPIVKELNLYPGESPDDSVERMRNYIHITFVAGPGKHGKIASAFDVEFTYPDRHKAQQTVEALINAFMFINQDSSRRDAIATDRPVSSVVVLDIASLPEAPFYPSGTVVLLSGLLVGVLTAILWRAIQRRGLIARRFALMTVALGTIGIIAAVTAGSVDLIPYSYRSTATLRLNHGTQEQVAAITSRVLSRTYLSMVVNDPQLMLYGNEPRTVPPEEVLRKMRRHIEIDPQGTAVWIAFDYPDRYKARMTVEALMNQFNWASMEMFPVSARASLEPPVILDVLDTANLPSSPSKPNRPVIALVGGILGIILGALISVVRRLSMPPAIAPLHTVNG